MAFLIATQALFMPFEGIAKLEEALFPSVPYFFFFEGTEGFDGAHLESAVFLALEFIDAAQAPADGGIKVVFN